MTLSFSPTQSQFLTLQQAINKDRITQLVSDQQQGKLSPDDKSYYENLYNDNYLRLTKLIYFNYSLLNSKSSMIFEVYALAPLSFKCPQDEK